MTLLPRQESPQGFQLQWCRDQAQEHCQAKGQVEGHQWAFPNCPSSYILIWLCWLAGCEPGEEGQGDAAGRMSYRMAFPTQQFECSGCWATLYNRHRTVPDRGPSECRLKLQEGDRGKIDTKANRVQRHAEHRACIKTTFTRKWQKPSQVPEKELSVTEENHTQ